MFQGISVTTHRAAKCAPAINPIKNNETGPSAWTVLLADEHPLVVEGLRRTLSSPEFTIVGLASDGQALVKAALDIRPDLIITCISLPLLDGIEAARQIHRAGSRSKVILLSKHQELTFAIKALKAGVKGFLPKTTSPGEVLHAVREVLRHKVYMPPRVEQAVSERIQSGRGDQHELTSRQREVLQLLTEGKAPKEIARTLNISPRTVEFHKYSMLRKLRLGTMAELLVWAAKQEAL